MLHTALGCSCVEPGFSSPVAHSALVSERQCLMWFSLRWEKQPTLEIKPLCWFEERIRDLPRPPRLPPLLQGLPNLPGEAETPPPRTHWAPRSCPHPLFTRGCLGTTLGRPRAPHATACPFASLSPCHVLAATPAGLQPAGRGKHLWPAPHEPPLNPGTYRRTGSGMCAGSTGTSRESSRRLAANRTLPLKVGLGETGGRDPPSSLHPCVMGPVHRELAQDTSGRR